MSKCHIILLYLIRQLLRYNGFPIDKCSQVFGNISKEYKVCKLFNHMKTWRWSIFFLIYFKNLFIFKAFIEYGVREWELHKLSLNLTTFCATESEVSVVPPPHLFSFLLTQKKKKTSATNISNNKSLFNYKGIGVLHDWKSNMMGMKTWNIKKCA